MQNTLFIINMCESLSAPKLSMQTHIWFVKYMCMQIYSKEIACEGTFPFIKRNFLQNAELSTKLPYWETASL